MISLFARASSDRFLTLCLPRHPVKWRLRRLPRWALAGVAGASGVGRV
jgi:hypothetical protein